MHARHYRQMIERAVQGNDNATLDKLAGQLADCENAKQMLRIKGYGCTGMAVSATVALVPALRTTLTKDESQRRKG